jgi:2-polyprenyl-6-methoxyphenol hydroxylase-like FAD-dependent oxidoreductase
MAIPLHIVDVNIAKSIILEKEREINHDPRGVYLNGDAVRILWDLGLERWEEIGHGMISTSRQRRFLTIL